MTQKHIISRAVEFAALPFHGDQAKEKAARATCALAWLEGVNCNAEARTLAARVCSDMQAAAAFVKIATDKEQVTELRCIGSLCAWIFNGRLDAGEWLHNDDTKLVEEVWPLISGVPVSSAMEAMAHQNV